MSKVKSGERLAIAANDWNGMLDASDAHRRSRLGTGSPGGGAGGIGSPGENLVLVKNATGGNLERLAVLMITGVAVTPTDSGETFKQLIAVVGETPDADTGERFVVTVEPIATGNVGRAIAAGVLIATVDMAIADHRFARATEGDASKFTSAIAGPVSILWVESGTGNKLAVVRFGSSGLSTRWGKQASYTAGSNTVTLTPCDAAGVVTGEADVSVSITLPTGKVGCSFYGGEDTDVLAYYEIDGARWLVSVPMPATTTKRAHFQATNNLGQGGWDYAKIATP